MKEAPVAAAIANAAAGSLRSTLTPTGAELNSTIEQMILVIAAIVTGWTCFWKGTSPKFSTMMASTPPARSVFASVIASRSTLSKLPQYPGDPGKAFRCTMPMIPVGVCFRIHSPILLLATNANRNVDRAQDFDWVSNPKLSQIPKYRVSVFLSRLDVPLLGGKFQSLNL